MLFCPRIVCWWALLGCVWRMCITDDQQGCQYTVNGGFRSLPRWWETLQPFLRKRIFGGKKIWIPKYWHLFAFVCFFAYGWFHYGTSPLNPPFGAYFFIFVPPPLSKSKLSFTFLWKVQKFKPTKYRYISAGNPAVCPWDMVLGPQIFWNPFVSWGSFHHLVLVGMTYPPVKSPSFLVNTIKMLGFSTARLVYRRQIKS